MKEKKIKLAEKDLHIIDVYSKKNLSDPMYQIVNPSDKALNQVTGFQTVNLEK